MYAIVDIAGQQFKVEAGNQVFVNRQAAEVGSSLVFDKVLLLENEGKGSVINTYNYLKNQKFMMLILLKILKF